MPASNTSLPLIMPIFQALLPVFGKHEEHRSPRCPARSVLVVKQTTVRMVSVQSGGDRRENKMSTARLLESKMMDGRKKIFWLLITIFAGNTEENKFKWRWRNLCLLFSPFEQHSDTEQEAGCGIPLSCTTYRESVIKSLTVLLNVILPYFLQGMTDFLFLYSKEYHCFLSENKTRAKPLRELGSTLPLPSVISLWTPGFFWWISCWDKKFLVFPHLSRKVTQHCVLVSHFENENGI